MVDQVVAGDPIEPGRERQAPRLVAIEALERLEEYLLGQILGRLAATVHLAEQVPPDLRGELLVQLAECPAVPALRPLDQGLHVIDAHRPPPSLSRVARPRRPPSCVPRRAPGGALQEQRATRSLQLPTRTGCSSTEEMAHPG